MKSGSTAELVSADVPPTVSVTSPLVIGRGGGLTIIDRMRACSNSRLAKASIINGAGDCTGAVGALLANGDRTALITLDTRCDNGSAGVGVMTVEAGVGAPTDRAALEDVGAAVIATDGVAGANDGRPAGTTRTASRRRGRAEASVVGALTANGFGLDFIEVSPDAGREVREPLRRASVRGASSFAGVVAAPFDEVEVDGVRAVVAADADEPVVVLVCAPREPFTAPNGFSGRG